jgi:hypothetical protein
MATNDFFTLLGIEQYHHVMIGSRTYMDAPNSDYDYMCYIWNKDEILLALTTRGIEYSVNAHGTIQILISFSKTSRFEIPQTTQIHICFIKDFGAWEKATDCMKIVSKKTGLFSNWSKKDRIGLFCDFVVYSGGDRPKNCY